MVTLRQLRYLNALARHRHFGRAADACAVSQPALSMQIKEMEKDLGVTLVERRSNDVVLTETGLEIARRGERILSEVNDLEDFATHRGGVLSGTLKFGVIPSIAPYMLPRLLPVLQEETPRSRAGITRDANALPGRRAGAWQSRRHHDRAAGAASGNRNAASVR